MHQECINGTTTQVEPVLPHSMGNKCRGEDYWQTMLRWIWKTYLVEALVLNPARAQVRAAVRGGKEAGAWRRVLLPLESGCPLCKRWLQPEREGTGGKSPSNPTSTQATGGKDSGWLLPLALQVLCLYLCSVHTSFSHFQYGFMKKTFWIHSDSWLTVMVTKKPLEGEFHSSNNVLHSSSVCS